MRNLSYYLLAFVIILSSCSDDEDCCVLPPQPYEAGTFVLNQGKFNDGTGSVTFIDTDNNVEQDVFQTVNNRPLGNIVQSMSFHNGKGFILVNNAAKVEVVNADNFLSIATIENLAQPRYYQGINNAKGYLSQWGSDGITGAIKVINFDDHSVVKTIATGFGTERMLLNGNDLIAANSGGFGSDSTIVIINTTTDEISQKIELGKNPTSLVKESDGDIWVLCAGNFSGVNGSIYELNGMDYTVKRSINLSSGAYGSNIIIDPNSGKLLFNVFSGVYTIDPSISNPSPTLINSTNFYGLGVDQEGNIYGADAKDFASAGEAIVFDMNGNLLNSFTTGIVPGNFTFK